MPEDNKLSDFLDYMERLKNYERLGVPRGAGMDSDDGFHLGRMRRLLQRLENPHTHFWVKEVVDQSIELENGALTYFEVFTALAFALFSQEKVDIAITEVGICSAPSEQTSRSISPVILLHISKQINIHCFYIEYMLLDNFCTGSKAVDTCSETGQNRGYNGCNKCLMQHRTSCINNNIYSWLWEAHLNITLNAFLGTKHSP